MNNLWILKKNLIIKSEDTDQSVQNARTGYRICVSHIVEGASYMKDLMVTLKFSWITVTVEGVLFLVNDSYPTWTFQIDSRYQK